MMWDNPLSDPVGDLNRSFAVPDGCSETFCLRVLVDDPDASHAMTIDELLPEIDRALGDYRTSADA